MAFLPTMKRVKNPTVKKILKRLDKKGIVAFRISTDTASYDDAKALYAEINQALEGRYGPCYAAFSVMDEYPDEVRPPKEASSEPYPSYHDRTMFFILSEKR